MSEIDAMLQKKAAETSTPNDKEAFNIRIYHKITEAADNVPVYSTNTLGQVIQGYGELIGLKAGKEKYWFYNENVKPVRSTSEQSTTIAQFGIGPGDTLSISDEGSVAVK